ncbi:DUF4345 family protein [Ruegeria halocynthiae]|uniref:DUF4345 family protein n=1 Tax=Ruegeria halocynthiae TaxID=985054 RepID=UPI000568A9AF|nr:DUF4345 family protein [Ruegeria halocynthiae]
MKIARILLVIIGLGHIALGLYGTLATSDLLASLEIEALTADGLIEARTWFGGSPLAAGLFITYAAWNMAYARAGFLFFAIYMFGYFTARLYGAAVAGTLSDPHMIAAIVEIGEFFVALLGLWLLRHQDRTDTGS